MTNLVLLITMQFVPEAFVIPVSHETATYRLEPLGPKLVKVDYDAYMSSIEHLQKTFSGPGWPTATITMADAIKDMLSEEERFRTRKSFAYAVLTKDGSRELGSVYVRPSKKPGFDAAVTMWVTKAEFDRGFDPVLFAEVKRWVAAKWPFKKVEYPRRETGVQ